MAADHVGAYPAALAPQAGTVNQGFGFWWVALAVITGLGTIAALGANLALTGVLATLAVGAGFTAAGWFAPSEWSLNVGGWLFVASAILALYTAAAMMFEGSFGRTILPLGKFRAAAAGRARPQGGPAAGVRAGPARREERSSRRRWRPARRFRYSRCPILDRS